MGTFAHDQFQIAIEMVASIWCSAWVDAGRPWLGVAGDFSGDGTIDAADYVLWRKSVGAPAGTLLNDTDGGPIGQAQYDSWKGNFGATTGGSSFTSGAIPERPTVMLPTLAAMAASARRRVNTLKTR